jgi:MFS family permease
MDTSIQPPLDPYSPEVKRRTLVAVLTQVLIGNMMVSNLMAFLPIFVETNEWEKDANGVSSQLTSNDVGFIIASFSLAQVMFSPVNSLIKNYLGTKNAISIGMLLVGISTALLGFIARV